MKKTVAIIGATGRVGSALAKCFARTENRLILMSPNEGKLNHLVRHIRYVFEHSDIEKASSLLNCCWEADIIILAVPFRAEKEVATIIKEVATQKIVISLANRLNSHFEDAFNETSEAEELQKILQHSKVVKAFNITHGTDFSKAVIPKDCFIAGNDASAVAEVSKFIIPAGFNPLLSGKLYQCRVLESTQTMLSTINTLHKSYQL